ncbi:MAG: protein kinase [Planctomycetes bacterium]|nr:protein kinase [Planctomycetota bacterium]
MIGPYRLDAVLGRGGMGTVHAATVAEATPTAPPVGTRVAVKVLHAHLAEEASFVERFEREARAGLAVHHPGVVRVLDVGKADDGGALRPYLVMELVEGTPLSDVLGDLGKVPEGLARHIGREVARALAAIHEAGLVHRDVKPGNVLLTPDERVRLLDLGVARWHGAGSTRLSETGQFVGSILYAAPEQLAGEESLDGRADLYALGLLLHELVVGHHPFEAPSLAAVIRRQLDETAAPPSASVPDVSPWFDEVVATLLAKDPAGRFADARALARVLDAGEDDPWWQEREEAMRARSAVRLPRLRVARETALVARDEALVQLGQALLATRGGSGRAVLVGGEAGIGKTRLLDAFLRSVHAADPAVRLLAGAWPPGEAATAYDAFLDALRQHLAGPGLERDVAGRLGAMQGLAAELAASLGRGDDAVGGSRPELLAPDVLRAALLEVVKSLAAEGTTVLVVDGLEDAPAEGRSLFAALAAAAADVPLLLIGTHRGHLAPAWVADLKRLGHVTSLDLPRLDRAGVEALLCAALGSEALAHDLVRPVARRSEGNPLFVLEVVRALRETRVLERRTDGTWRATRPLHDVPLPSGVSDLVRAHLHGLESEDRDLLDVAACCGLEFDATLVGAALGLGRLPVLRRLARLESDRRLVRSVGKRFAFDHPTLRDVVYEALPEALRAEYHAVLFDALAAEHDLDNRGAEGLPGPVRAALCHHAFEAGRGREAADLVGPALAHHVAEQRPDAAVQLARRALEAPGVLRGLPRLHVLVEAARLLALLGRRDDLGPLLDEALLLTSEDVDDHDTGAAARGHVLRLMGEASIGPGLYDEGEARLAEAVRHLAAAGDAREEGMAHGALGTIAWRQGDFARAREQHEAHRDLAASVGDVAGEARALTSLGLLEHLAGRAAEAREVYERALTLATEHGLTTLAASAHNSLAVSWRSVGRRDRAIGHLEQALRLARAGGDRRSEASIVGNLGNLHKDQGDLRRALDAIERQRHIAREVQDRRSEGIATLNTGLTCLHLGMFDEAEARLLKAMMLFELLHEERFLAHARGFHAQWSETSGDAEGAESGYREALEGLRALGAEPEALDYAAYLGRCLRDRGAIEEARELLDHVVDAATTSRRENAELMGRVFRVPLAPDEAQVLAARLDEHGERLSVWARMMLRHDLAVSTGDVRHARAAREALARIEDGVDHDDRRRMAARVPLVKAVHEAVRANDGRDS